jgi:hypothetical protein
MLPLYHAQLPRSCLLEPMWTTAMQEWLCRMAYGEGLPVAAHMSRPRGPGSKTTYLGIDFSKHPHSQDMAYETVADAAQKKGC